MMEELEVIEILSTAYDGDEFPGYENIRLSFSQLETIIRNKRSGWLDALRNQKAVYLITDTSNGKMYVGSATAQYGMLLQRWTNYIDNGHGGNGVLNPLIVRPKIEGYYEIISGHRRKYAAEKLGYKKIPVIIRMLQDDEAVVIMVDSNLQREQITPSEKAYAYKMKYDAIKKRQAERIVVKLTTIQERGVLT